MPRSLACRTLVLAALLWGGAGAAQEVPTSGRDSSALRSLVRVPEVPAKADSVTPTVANTVERREHPLLSRRARSGFFLGAAMGAQVGAVLALHRCGRQPENDCVQGKVGMTVALTVGAGLVGALIGGLMEHLDSDSAPP